MAAVRLMLMAAVSAATVSCEVTSDDIQTWKQTVKGAAKLRAAIRDQSQTTAVRVEAAAALSQMGLLAPLTEDVMALAPADRERILPALSNKLIQTMEGENPAATTGTQIRAKDALYSLRGHATDSEKANIDDRVVRWLLADWQKRSSGEHGGEKVITDVGARAGPTLAEMLGKGTPLVVTATLLRKVGGQAERDKAARRLVDLAAKQKPPRVQTFHAMGKVGSLIAVQHFDQVAQKGALEARLWALRALSLFPHRSVVTTARTIAADASLKGDRALLRDEAFTVLEKTGDKGALEALSGLLRSGEELVRYRAAEAMLNGFGVRGLTLLLQGLPSRYTYRKEDLTDFIERDIQKLGSKALPPLRKALSSRSWIARLIAARALGRLGTKQDVTALKKLGRDRKRLKGWGGRATVGSEAMAAAKLLERR